MAWTYKDQIDEHTREVFLAAAHLGLNIVGLADSLAMQDQVQLDVCREAAKRLQKAVDGLVYDIDTAWAENIAPREMEVETDLVKAIKNMKFRGC